MNGEVAAINARFKGAVEVVEVANENLRIVTARANAKLVAVGPAVAGFAYYKGANKLIAGRFAAIRTLKASRAIAVAIVALATVLAANILAWVEARRKEQQRKGE